MDALTDNQEKLARHILPTSATMLGVCMTVISIIKLLHLGRSGTLIDKVLALDSLVFVASGILSYVSMRKPLLEHLERWADATFMVGFLGMGVCAVLLAFELV
jgi:multisubunit Na+/H+ antiporter MnhF subunit